MDGGDTLTSMTPLSPVDEVTVTSQRPLDAALTLSPHQRGPGDPAHRRSADGAIWRVSRQLSGPVTYRITQSDRHTVRVQAWGPGATEFLTGAEALLGLDDEAEDFAPEHPKLAEAHRRFPHLRIGRTGRVMEALVPAILEQRVHGIDAFAAWRPAADQIRGAPTRPRARRNASSTHRGPMASNAVMGIPSRERRSSEVQDDRSVRSRRRPPRAGIHVPQDRGDQTVASGTRRRDLDCRRSGSACIRRFRCTLGRRLPPFCRRRVVTAG